MSKDESNINKSLNNISDSNVKVDNSKVVNNYFNTPKILITLLIIFIISASIYLVNNKNHSSVTTKDSIQNLKDSRVSVGNTINILNDPKVIEENKELKNVVEVLFGKDYNSFLNEQKKSNPQLIIYLSKILDNKSIFETIEILKDEKTKREKLQKELEKAKESATSQSLKEIIPQAEKALAEFKYEKYHDILAKFEENNQNIVKDIAKTYFLRASEYYDRLEYQNAVEFMRKAVNFDEENSEYLNDYGYYFNVILAKYDEAIKYYEKALAIDLKTFGENHPNIAIRYNNLGVAYKEKGEYDKAIEYYTKALEIDIKTVGENHPNVAIRYNNLGVAYKEKGEYDKAIEYYTKALEIDLKILGEKHPNVAINYNNLGVVYRKQRNYNKAIEYYTKALEIDLKNFGKNHPNIAIRYNNLGVAYDNKGEYDKAIEYYEKALAIDLKTFGENHPTVAIRYNNLGSAYDSKGEYDKAIEYFSKALSIDLKTFGENHSSVAREYNNLGMSYRAKGEYDKAIEYYEKSLKILKDIFKDGHPYIDMATKSLKYAKEVQKKKI